MVQVEKGKRGKMLVNCLGCVLMVGLAVLTPEELFGREQFNCLKEEFSYSFRYAFGGKSTTPFLN